MKLRWLLEDAFSEDLDPLIAEITKQGMEYKVIKYIPFQGGEYGNLFGEDDPVICYTSLNLARQFQRENHWCPGSYCTFKNFECTTYNTYFNKYLLNKEYVMLSISELIRQKDMIFNLFGIDDTIFVRPNSGSKPFTGCTVKKEELSLDYFGFGYYHEDRSLLVVISSSKVITDEWRFVICDKKVVSCSHYRINGEYFRDVPDCKQIYPKELFDYASMVALEEWEPDPIYVMDICRSNDEYHLLELNSFSCSGLYNADPEPIIRVASERALKDWEEAHL